MIRLENATNMMMMMMMMTMMTMMMTMMMMITIITIVTRISDLILKIILIGTTCKLLHMHLYILGIQHEERI